MQINVAKVMIRRIEKSFVSKSYSDYQFSASGVNNN
jgi:hypothetical protein